MDRSLGIALFSSDPDKQIFEHFSFRFDDYAKRCAPNGRHAFSLKMRPLPTKQILASVDRKSADKCKLSSQSIQIKLSQIKAFAFLNCLPKFKSSLTQVEIGEFERGEWRCGVHHSFRSDQNCEKRFFLNERESLMKASVHVGVRPKGFQVLLSGLH